MKLSLPSVFWDKLEHGMSLEAKVHMVWLDVHYFNTPQFKMYLLPLLLFT